MSNFMYPKDCNTSLFLKMLQIENTRQLESADFNMDDFNGVLNMTNNIL